VVYATLVQVLSQCGRLSKSIDGASTPSVTDVIGFIADRAAQIDEALQSRGLATPLTAQSVSAGVLASFARLNAEGAAADTMLAAYITNDGNDRGTGAIKLKSFETRIAQLYKGEGVPVAMPVMESDLAPRSYFTDNPPPLAPVGALPSDFGADSSQPWFTRGMRG
jgi:hypothetical protein